MRAVVAALIVLILTALAIWGGWELFQAIGWWIVIPGVPALWIVPQALLAIYLEISRPGSLAGLFPR